MYSANVYCLLSDVLPLSLCHGSTESLSGLVILFPLMLHHIVMGQPVDAEHAYPRPKAALTLEAAIL